MSAKGAEIVVSRMNMAFADCGLPEIAYTNGTQIAGHDDGRVTAHQFVKAYSLVMLSAGRTKRNVRCRLHVPATMEGLCSHITPIEAAMGNLCTNADGDTG